MTVHHFRPAKSWSSVTCFHWHICLKFNSCGTVPPHGVDELAHPEHNFYIVGMKSYGRAPTFLMLTGYEQVRSVVAALTGDWESARRVELELPETGVCSTEQRGSCVLPAQAGDASFPLT